MHASSVSKIKVNDPVSSNSAPTMGGGSIAPSFSEDIDDMLASFSSNKTLGGVGFNDQRKAARYRVRWHADILIDGQRVDSGFIKDISTQGASIYLNTSLHIEKC